MQSGRLLVDSSAESFGMFRAVKTEGIVFLTFLLLTLLMTWPWVLHLRDGVPDTGDPYAHAYFLWWDFRQTFNDPLHLFQANIFYPYEYTLAFSENDYGIALPFFAFFALGFRPLTIEILATLTGFAFTGYGMFRLTRTLTFSNGAAWVAGVIFAFVPYRFNQLSHLPIIFTGWMPLLLEALILFSRRQSWPRAAWLGTAFLMNGLTCLTWLILTLVPLGLSGILLVSRCGLWKSKNFWFRAGVALGLATLALLPFLYPYYWVSKTYGLIRSREDVAQYSAHLQNWFAAEVRNKLWRGFGGNAVRNEMVLFPGLLPLLFAVAAFLPARLKSFAKVARSSKWIEGLEHGLIWMTIGFLGSFGVNGFLHNALFDFFPAFRGMRVAARWSMIAYLGLALIAAAGSVRLAERLERHWPGLRHWVSLGVILVAILFEQRVAPLTLVQGKVDADELTLRLKKTRMSGGIVELPAGPGRHLYMLRAADHGQPLVTAMASFVTPVEQEIESLTRSRPVPDQFLDLLETIPSSYLVIHNETLYPESRLALEAFLERGIATGRLRFIRSYGEQKRSDLYAVTKTEPQAISEAPRPARLTRQEIDEELSGLPPLFQTTGFRVCRFYRASYGRLPTYAEFQKDAQLMRGGVLACSSDEPEQLDASDREFAAAWIARPEFKRMFGADDDRYVDRLFSNAGITDNRDERNGLAKDLRKSRLTRADVLLRMIENEEFVSKEFNASFVLMHYFAVFRRDPDNPGFNFWLNMVESGVEVGEIHRAFVSSPEAEAVLRAKQK